MLAEVLSGGTLRLLSRIKIETLFSPFVFSLLVKLFICFVGSYSRLLMPDITLLLYITGWIACSIFRNLTNDKDFKPDNLSRFPYGQTKKENLWFKETVSIDGRAKTINMLNLRRCPRLNYPKLDDAVFPPRKEDLEGYTMLYHGTNQHEHAKSIIGGILLSESKDDLDFGKGFYVTKDFKTAKKYAFVTSAKAAVFAFQIPNEVFDKFTSLKVMGDGGDEHKRRYEEKLKIIEKGLLENDVRFIEGPEMKRERDGANVKKTYEPRPDTHQICIRDEEMAEEFDKHLHSVVFYSTSKTGR